MAKVKADAPMVWLGCAHCGERFGQPYGAVTSRICPACLRAAAARFWAVDDQDEAKVQAAASELLAAVYRGLF